MASGSEQTEWLSAFSTSASCPSVEVPVVGLNGMTMVTLTRLQAPLPHGTQNKQNPAKTTYPKPKKNYISKTTKNPHVPSLCYRLLTFFFYILEFFASFSQQPLLLNLIFVSEFFF
jgi:hypothetical protein